MRTEFNGRFVFMRFDTRLVLWIRDDRNETTEDAYRAVVRGPHAHFLRPLLMEADPVNGAKLFVKMLQGEKTRGRIGPGQIASLQWPIYHGDEGARVDLAFPGTDRPYLVLEVGEETYHSFLVPGPIAVAQIVVHGDNALVVPRYFFDENDPQTVRLIVTPSAELDPRVPASQTYVQERPHGVHLIYGVIQEKGEGPQPDRDSLYEGSQRLELPETVVHQTLGGIRQLAGERGSALLVYTTRPLSAPVLRQVIERRIHCGLHLLPAPSHPLGARYVYTARVVRATEDHLESAVVAEIHRFPLEAGDSAARGASEPELLAVVQQMEKTLSFWAGAYPEDQVRRRLNEDSDPVLELRERLKQLINQHDPVRRLMTTPPTELTRPGACPLHDVAWRALNTMTEKLSRALTAYELSYFHVVGTPTYVAAFVSGGLGVGFAVHNPRATNTSAPSLFEPHTHLYPDSTLQRVSEETFHTHLLEVEEGVTGFVGTLANDLFGPTHGMPTYVGMLAEDAQHEAWLLHQVAHLTANLSQGDVPEEDWCVGDGLLSDTSSHPLLAPVLAVVVSREEGTGAALREEGTGNALERTWLLRRFVEWADRLQGEEEGLWGFTCLPLGVYLHELPHYFAALLLLLIRRGYGLTIDLDRHPDTPVRVLVQTNSERSTLRCRIDTRGRAWVHCQPQVEVSLLSSAIGTVGVSLQQRGDRIIPSPAFHWTDDLGKAAQALWPGVTLTHRPGPIPWDRLVEETRGPVVWVHFTLGGKRAGGGGDLVPAHVFVDPTDLLHRRRLWRTKLPSGMVGPLPREAMLEVLLHEGYRERTILSAQTLDLGQINWEVPPPAPPPVSQPPPEREQARGVMERARDYLARVQETVWRDLRRF